MVATMTPTTGNLILATTGALSTSATAGFPVVPTSAGAPTGERANRIDRSRYHQRESMRRGRQFRHLALYLMELTTGMLMVPTMAGAPTGTVGAAGQGGDGDRHDEQEDLFHTGGGTWECSGAFTP